MSPNYYEQKQQADYLLRKAKHRAEQHPDSLPPAERIAAEVVKEGNRSAKARRRQKDLAMAAAMTKAATLATEIRAANRQPRPQRKSGLFVRIR